MQFGRKHLNTLKLDNIWRAETLPPHYPLNKMGHNNLLYPTHRAKRK